MRCRSCGANNPEGARFCWSCGFSVDYGKSKGSKIRAVLIILLVGMFLGLVGYWLGWGSRFTVVKLEDGATARVPGYLAVQGPVVQGRILRPEETPKLPIWAARPATLYEFSATRQLDVLVELRIPIPQDVEIAVLSHYTNGRWEPVPFNYEGAVAVAQVQSLSVVGFIVSGYDKIEEFLKQHPLLNWVLGGGTQTGDPLCNPSTTSIKVESLGNTKLVSSCGESASGATELKVRNERRIYLDIYSEQGLQFLRGGWSPFSCCKGTVLPPEGRSSWDFQEPSDVEGRLRVKFSGQAAGLTVGKIVLAALSAWAAAGQDLPSWIEEIITTEEFGEFLAALRTLRDTSEFINQLDNESPDYAVVSRQILSILSNTKTLESIGDLLIKNRVFARAGVHMTTNGISKLLIRTSVLGQVRALVDLILTGLLGDPNAKIIFLRSQPSRPSPSPDGSAVTEKMPGSSTVLVMDVSTSMNSHFRGKSKLDGAKDAASDLLQFVADERELTEGQHRAGLVSFSSSAKEEFDLSENYPSLIQAIRGLRTIGGTNIGDGLEKGLAVIARHEEEGQRFLVLLSDGQTNEGMSREQILSGPALRAYELGTCIYAIGFGDPQELDESLLREIPRRAGCGEYLLATDASKLQSAYLRIRHLSLGTLAAELSGRVKQGQTAAAGSIQVPGGQSELVATLHWPGSRLELELRDPQGRIVDDSYPQARTRKSERLQSLIIQRPQSGQWQAMVHGRETNSDGSPFEVLVSTRAAPPASFPPQALAASAVAMFFFLLVISQLFRRPRPARSEPASGMLSRRACRKCARELPTSAVICPWCGSNQSVELAPGAALCGNCKALITISARFCPVCGRQNSPA